MPINNAANNSLLRKAKAAAKNEKPVSDETAYSTEFGPSFHLKLNTQSTANWTVGAKRR